MEIDTTSTSINGPLAAGSQQAGPPASSSPHPSPSQMPVASVVEDASEARGTEENMTVDQHPGQEQARAIGREAEEPPEPNKKEDVQEDGEAHVQRSGEGDRAAAGEGGAPRPRMAWEPCVTPSAGPNDRAAAAAGCMLPSSLACLGDLSKILNTTTWNESLSEDERQQLRALLPGATVAEKEETVERLFSGENFFFGNPVADFFTNLKLGFYHKDVMSWKSKVETLQRRKYELDLLSYRAKQLQSVLSWKNAAGLIKPGSAEAQILSRPPRRIYAPVSASDNGLEGSPASKKRKVLVKEKERQLREEEETFRNEIASKGKKSKKDKKDKKRRPEENGHSKKKKRKGEVYTEEMDEAAGSKKSKKAKENGGKPETKKAKAEKATQIATDETIPIVFVFFKKIREAFRKLNDAGTLRDILAMLKEIDAIEDDRLPQYPLKEFVKLALDFMAHPPPSSSPFSLGSTSSASSASSNNPSSPIKESMPIVRYESSTKLWRWVAKEHRSSALRLQSVEQLFYFAAARNMIDSKTGKLTLANIKQHKSAVTVEISSPEATASYRLQETERYNSPERPYTYVTNGMKAVVGPVKHSGSANRGPSNKPREHFLLKTKRPAHVNLLGLVRDATARLPGGVGTRPDVSMLLKDSQWVVETIPTGKLNAVVSGALDRLHSQNDPCVRFDPDQKLWIYLHRLRKEDDFEVQPFPKSKSKKALAAAASTVTTPLPAQSTPSTPSSQPTESPQRTPSPRSAASALPSPISAMDIDSNGSVQKDNRVQQSEKSAEENSLPDSLLSSEQQVPLTPPSSTTSSSSSSPVSSPPSAGQNPTARSNRPFSPPSFPQYSSSSPLVTPPKSSGHLPPLPSSSRHSDTHSVSSTTFPSLTLPPLPPSPTPISHHLPTHSSFSSPSMGTFRPLHMSSHISHGSSSSSSVLPFAHYSSVPPPTPLPPLHPHPATSVALRSPFSSSLPPASNSPSGSAGSSLPFATFPSSPGPSSTLPRLQLPPVPPSASREWPRY